MGEVRKINSAQVCQKKSILSSHNGLSVIKCATPTHARAHTLASSLSFLSLPHIEARFVFRQACSCYVPSEFGQCFIVVGHAIISHYTGHPVIILFTCCWRDAEHWGYTAQSCTLCSGSLFFLPLSLYLSSALHVTSKKTFFNILIHFYFSLPLAVALFVLGFFVHSLFSCPDIFMSWKKR